MLFKLMKNNPAVKVQQQEKICNSHVAVIGCGGIGAIAAELLVRAGVGEVTLVDNSIVASEDIKGDLLSDPSMVGKKKIYFIEDRLKEINSDVKVHTWTLKVGNNYADEMVKNANVVVCDMNDMDKEIIIENACKNAGITMIDTLCGGDDGYVSVITPGNKVVEKLHERAVADAAEVEIENKLMAASYAVNYAIRVLGEADEDMNDKTFCFNTKEGIFDICGN